MGNEDKLRAQLSEERRRLREDVAELRRKLPLIAAAGLVTTGALGAVVRRLVRRGR